MQALILDVASSQFWNRRNYFLGKVWQRIEPLLRARNSDRLENRFDVQFLQIADWI